MPRKSHPDDPKPPAVQLSTVHLQKCWDRELHSIRETPKRSVIEHHAIGALGFARGLHAGKLVSDAQLREMCAAVRWAEHGAYQGIKEQPPTLQEK